MLQLDAFLPYRLSVTSNLVSERIAQVYAALFALTIPQWRLIAVMAEGPAVSQQAICKRTHMDKVTVSRAASELVGRGLVGRSDNPDDKRSHLLSLTAAGMELYTSVAPKALEMEAQIFSSLSAAEADQLKALLAKVEDELA
jgi:DNA-binding MarR family transcriptional regulator